MSDAYEIMVTKHKAHVPENVVVQMKIPLTGKPEFEPKEYLVEVDRDDLQLGWFPGLTSDIRNQFPNGVPR